MTGPLRREDHRWEVFCRIMGAEPPDWFPTPYLDQELGPRQTPDKGGFSNSPGIPVKSP